MITIGTLVIILHPEDLVPFHLRQPDLGKPPKFGIVVKALDQEGFYSQCRHEVRMEDGATAVFRAGRLAPLLILPEEDVNDPNLTPSRAFTKWAGEIVLRKELLHLSIASRDFLMDMLVEVSGEA
jgi:hypothetical protein